MNQRFNNEITPRLLGAYELTQYLSMGKTRAIEFARKCGAERRFGKRMLFDRTVIDAELDKMKEEQI